MLGKLIRAVLTFDATQEIVVYEEVWNSREKLWVKTRRYRILGRARP